MSRGPRRLPGRPAKKQTKKQIETAENQAKALQMRKEGKSYHEIAEALGYAGASGAYYVVSTGLKSLVQEPAQELVTLQIERYNTLLEELNDIAYDPDSGLKMRLAAIDRILDTMAAINKLTGVDAPTKIAATTPDGKSPATLDMADKVAIIAAAMRTMHEK